MKITFSSCFYVLKSKFDSIIYQEWMNNFISIANNFNLVIYTDEKSSIFINTYNKPNIKIIIKPLECFITYRFKQNWISNHEKNDLLNYNSPLRERWDTSWELNMLWSEKVWFVNETILKKYFDTEFYGYCDIGYFRNRSEDIHTNNLQTWPSENIIINLDKTKVHYGCICNDNRILNYINKIIKKKNSVGLPQNPIPPNQNTISGGFFIIHKQMIEWWSIEYTTKLKLYFEHNYLVKDDQMIIADCIFSDPTNFKLYQERNLYFDNWFMFQRLLN